MQADAHKWLQHRNCSDVLYAGWPRRLLTGCVAGSLAVCLHGELAGGQLSS